VRIDAGLAERLCEDFSVGLCKDSRGFVRIYRKDFVRIVLGLGED
jgi:hypothetical protein